MITIQAEDEKRIFVSVVDSLSPSERVISVNMDLDVMGFVISLPKIPDNFCDFVVCSKQKLEADIVALDSTLRCTGSVSTYKSTFGGL